MAGDCSEESREFLKRNPLDKFGSYRVWTRRECLWGRARIPVVGMAFKIYRKRSALSRRSGVRQKEHLRDHIFACGESIWTA